MTEQSTLPAAPGVFSRQASGLVRVGGAWDVLIYNTVNISIGLGIAYNQFFGLSSYPGARPVLSTLLAGLGLLIVALTFYFWTVTLPRSGGIYVFLSRTISPAVAFMLSLVETVAQTYLIALAATLVVTIGVSPFLATVGAVADSPRLLDWATVAASPRGVFWIGLLVLALAAVLLTSGTRRYFLVQKTLFVIAMTGLVLLGILLAFASRATFAAHLSSLTGLDYDTVISTAQANGYQPRGFDLHATLTFVVFPFVVLAGGWSSIGLGGEIKRVRRSQLIGILGAVALCTLVVGAYDLLAAHAFGDTFQGAIAYNSLNDITAGSTEGAIGAAPYISVLVGILAGNIPLAVLILATFAVWIWFWLPCLIAYSSRSMIAWSFDRIVPDRLGYVSERFHTPVASIWTFTAGAAVYLYLIEFHHLALFTMLEVLFATWLVAIFAAIIFPYRRPVMYAASPVSRLRVFGLPAMQVTACAAFVFFGFFEYQMWKDPVVAGPLIKSPLPLEFWILAGTVVVGALWYAGVKAYRRRSGIDIGLAFQQIPIE